MTTKPLMPRPLMPMTPSRYILTGQDVLEEIAPQWELLQVFLREPQEKGFNCGAMFYIGPEIDDGSSRVDKASLFYGSPCLEETALALSALIPLHPDKHLNVLMVRNTKSIEAHDNETIWQGRRSSRSNSETGIYEIRQRGENLPDLMEPVKRRPEDLKTMNPYFILPGPISRNNGVRGVERGYRSDGNPYGVAIELLLRGENVGTIVRAMSWGEIRPVYRRNHFIKFASQKLPMSDVIGYKQTVQMARATMYSKVSLVGEYGAW